MAYDKEYLSNLLVEVQKEVDDMMKSELDTLQKARPGEETTGEGESDSSSSDPSGETSGPASKSPDAASASPDAAGSDSAPPADDASAAAPPADDGSAPPADGSAPPADGSAPADPAMDAGPIDPQQLMAEYAQLSPEDLKAHYLACKEALVQVLGAAGADDGSAPPAPGADASAAAAAPPPPAASAPPGPTLKSEIPAGKEMKEPKNDADLPGPPNGDHPLSKSEDFQAAVDAAVEGAVGPLIKAVKLIVESPMRKSIAFAADLPKVAGPDVTQMSREEIRTKLSEKIKTGTLTKSEKDLVINFDTGKVDASAVAHLLK